MENELTMTDFDRDMLFLAIATANLEKYNVLSFRDSSKGCYIHVNPEIFEQLAQGREVTERGRDSTEYPVEKSFMLHGIEVLALYPAGEDLVQCPSCYALSVPEGNSCVNCGEELTKENSVIFPQY